MEDATINSHSHSYLFYLFLIELGHSACSDLEMSETDHDRLCHCCFLADRL